MVFSIDTIKESQSLSFPKYGAEDNESIFESALNAILEENVRFNALLDQYIGERLSITLNKDGLNITSGFDFGRLFEKIFEWFIGIIENLAGNFRAFLVGFLNRSSQLKMYKNQLMNFRGRVHYGRLYYNYRNLDLDTSYTSYANEIEKEYNTLMSALSSIRSTRNLTDLVGIINDIREENRYDVSEMDIIRGKSLGLHEEISSADYADKIFEFFRYSSIPIDPNVSKNEKNIDGMRVHEAAKSFYNAKAQELKITRDKKKLQYEADNQKKMIKRIKLEDFLSPGIKLNGEVSSAFNEIIMNKCKKVKEICDIYTMLFSGKLDALKEYNAMNRLILIEAVKEIARQEGK